MASELHDLTAMKVAVEGCGHGTLHAIYASVEESCKAKGWEGVDVLLIGGDFQAVRNKLDLNVTAMPVKFRRMADFHEYYSGQRKAPCLTIFVGGNHEASNYLFELYYGGWVAPNIYYMGVANVLRLGPLRIAGMSGIWKGYDYRKPHFERLPYNRDDIQSIYHVRELDIRKLLSLRTQVDVCMSHDWPQGVEWAGDYQWLFRKKDMFQADAESGRLGSVAVKQCFDRLRPAYWFSAHLHIKYPARVEHGQYEAVRQGGPRMENSGPRRMDPASDAANPDPVGTKQIDESVEAQPLQDHTNATPESGNASKLTAWQNFHSGAAEQDAAELERYREAQAALEQEEAKSGNSNVPHYQFEETWRKVEVDEDLNREVKSVAKPGDGGKRSDHAMGLDGCNESKEAADEADEAEQPIVHPLSGYGTTGKNGTHAADSAPAVHNEDEIDIDMDDSDGEGVSTELSNAHVTEPAPAIHNADEINVDMADSEEEAATDKVAKANIETMPPVTSSKVEPTEAGDVDLSAKTDGEYVDVNPGISGIAPEPEHQAADNDQKMAEATAMEMTTPAKEEEEVSEEMRAELAAISSKFKAPEVIEVSPALPLPEAISNKATKFLALDKCEERRDFLQLLEVSPISTAPAQQYSRPFRLEYDPEWLAIQRVFAAELSLGGQPDDRVPQHRGDTYYRQRIVEEEEWVKTNIVAVSSLLVPENFTQTAPVFDPEPTYGESQMPCEYTNPQTAAYCKMLDIENKFEMSEQERDVRMAAGPRKEKENFRGGRGRGGFGGGRGRGGFNNRGGRGGRGGGGRGRGRGGRGGNRY